MKESKKYTWVNKTVYSLILFLLVFLVSCKSAFEKDELIDSEKAITFAEINRKTIGPKEKEIVHFIFEIKGQIFTGKEWVNEKGMYAIGDSISIDYAKSNPSLNRISK